VRLQVLLFLAILIVCTSDFRIDKVVAKFVDTRNLLITPLSPYLSTTSGLVIRNSFTAPAATRIDSEIYLKNNATMQFNYSNIAGNVYMDNWASLIIQNSTITGTLSTNERSWSSVSNSTITGNVVLSGHSTLAIQNSNVQGNFSLSNRSYTLAQDSTFGSTSNNAILEIGGVVTIIGDFNQSQQGSITFNNVSFSAPSESANRLRVSGNIFLYGTLSCNIVNNTEFNLTKKIYLIYYDGENVGTSLSRLQSIGQNFNDTVLKIVTPAHIVGVKVALDMVSLGFGVVAVGLALIGAFIFIFLTRAPSGKPIVQDQQVN